MTKKIKDKIIEEFKELLFRTVIEKEETKGVGFATLLLSFYKTLSHQKDEFKRVIGKKRHYDLEEYDHDSKMMSVGFNKCLDELKEAINKL